MLASVIAVGQGQERAGVTGAVQQGQLHGHLHRQAAVQREADPLEVTRRFPRHRGGQAQQRHGIEVRPQVGQLAGLGEGGLGDLGAGRAEVVRPGHRGAVDVLAARGVPDERALRLGDDQAGLAARGPAAQQRVTAGGQVIGVEAS